MRLVQVTIPAGKKETVLSVLDDEGIDYVLTDETSGRRYTGVVYFPLPKSAVEPVLERLREVGLDEQAYTVVLSAETVVSRRFEALKEEYEEREEADERIAREELQARAQDLASTWPIYIVMTAVSAIIATAGLLLDSPATVVGSMVIAPLIGPAMATAVGSVVDDDELFARGVRMQIAGMALAVAAAAAFAAAVDVLNLVPDALDPAGIEQVRERLNPDFLSLAVALGSGVAGAVALTSGVSTALVGVMIAVALVPPAATVGIGIAYGDPSMVLSSGVLAVVNGLSINLAALLVLWYSGYRPERFFRVAEARTATVRRVAFIVAVIALLSLFLGGVTYDSYRTSNTESAVEAAVGEVVAPDGPYGERYAAMTVFDVDVMFAPQDPVFLLHRPSRVVVTMGVPPDRSTAGVTTVLDREVDEAAGTDVELQVRYVTYETVE
ncbi:TIGR00341 family protein [Halorarius halobius]|uniref:TIGR00341 family protein n=1 Tax=Halorarius halobius TaxID=2962671 RepID=UPI0020CCE0C4|nr:TIGR00341 family protein [Halorarius halobius]